MQALPLQFQFHSHCLRQAITDFKPQPKNNEASPIFQDQADHASKHEKNQ
jgi:hypothetical protein